jgi:hypothetical protein
VKASRTMQTKPEQNPTKANKWRVGGSFMHEQSLVRVSLQKILARMGMMVPERMTQRNFEYISSED